MISSSFLSHYCACGYLCLSVCVFVGLSPYNCSISTLHSKCSANSPFIHSTNVQWKPTMRCQTLWQALEAPGRIRWALWLCFRHPQAGARDQQPNNRMCCRLHLDNGKQTSRKKQPEPEAVEDQRQAHSLAGSHGEREPAAETRKHLGPVPASTSSHRNNGSLFLTCLPSSTPPLLPIYFHLVAKKVFLRCKLDHVSSSLNPPIAPRIKPKLLTMTSKGLHDLASVPFWPHTPPWLPCSLYSRGICPFVVPDPLPVCSHLRALACAVASDWRGPPQTFSHLCPPHHSGIYSRSPPHRSLPSPSDMVLSLFSLVSSWPLPTFPENTSIMHLFTCLLSVFHTRLFHEGSLSCSQLYSQCLEQRLAHRAIFCWVYK